MMALFGTVPKSCYAVEKIVVVKLYDCSVVFSLRFDGEISNFLQKLNNIFFKNIGGMLSLQPALRSKAFFRFFFLKFYQINFSVAFQFLLSATIPTTAKVS